MKIIKELLIITSFCFVGIILKEFFHIPIPGNVFGMVLLFFFLLFKILKIDQIKTTSNFLLKELAFFFIPPAVSLIKYKKEIFENGPAFGIIIILSTFIVMITTGLTIQILINIKGGKK